MIVANKRRPHYFHKHSLFTRSPHSQTVYRLLCLETGGRPLYVLHMKPSEEKYIHPKEKQINIY